MTTLESDPVAIGAAPSRQEDGRPPLKVGIVSPYG